MTKLKQVSCLGDRLKEYRDIANITLAEMAQKCRIPAQTINRYELKQRAPKLDIALEIADALSINPLWLQGYDIPMEQPSTAAPITLTKAESAMLNLFRSVPPEEQEALLMAVEVALRSKGLL